MQAIKDPWDKIGYELTVYIYGEYCVFYGKLRIQGQHDR